MAENLSLYDKQNLYLNYPNDLEQPNSTYLETNKYYLIFLHPDGESKTKNIFIPALTIDQPPMRSATPVAVPFGGETGYYQPSATEYNPLSATLVDTDDLGVRTYLQELLLRFARPTEDTCLLKAAIIVFDRDNNYLRTIEMNNAFLSSISPVSLNWQTPNQVAYYSITVHYSYASNTLNQYGFEDVIDYYRAISELYGN